MAQGLRALVSMANDDIRLKTYPVSASNGTAIFDSDMVVLNPDGTVSPYAVTMQTMALTLAVSATGGTLGAGTHKYRAVAFNSDGFIIGISPEQAIVLGATDKVTATLTAVTGAETVAVIRSASSVSGVPVDTIVYTAASTSISGGTVVDTTPLTGASATIPPMRIKAMEKAFLGVCRGVRSAKASTQDDASLPVGTLNPLGIRYLAASTAGFVDVIDDPNMLYLIDADLLVGSDARGAGIGMNGGSGNTAMNTSANVALSNTVGDVPQLPLKIYGDFNSANIGGNIASGLPNTGGFAVEASPGFVVANNVTGSGPAAGVVYYRLVVYSGASATGDVLYISPEIALLGDGNCVACTFTAPPGMASYRVYGKTQGATGYVAQVNATTNQTNVQIDTVAAATASSLPTTANRLVVQINNHYLKNNAVV